MRYQYRFLLLDTDRNLTLLFGYRLALSPAETALVKALLTEGSAGVRTVAGIPARSLPVHVCSVNRKATEIGGRRLIAYRDGAYRLNPMM